MKENLHIIETGPLRYMLALPPDIAPDTDAAPRKPVLCFLHGYGEAAPMDIGEALCMHGPLRQANAYRAADHFIIVAPQLEIAGDLWHKNADKVKDIVTTVQTNWGGDRERTYLTGFSYGGNGVMDLAILQRDFWAALWPVDPTRIPAEDPVRPLWLSMGEIARAQKKAFIKALALQSMDDASSDAERIWLDQGDDHVRAATRAYQDEYIYRWLLQKRLR